MTVGKVEKQTSQISRINLRHTLEGKKSKQTSNHTDTHKQTAAKSIYYNKKSKDNPTVTRESTKSHTRKLCMRPKQRTSIPAYSTYYSNTTTYFITYHIHKSESRKIAEETEKFWESDVSEKKRNTESLRVNDKKDVNGTVLEQATKKFWSLYFFCRTEVVNFFHKFSACFELHSIDQPSCKN